MFINEASLLPVLLPDLKSVNDLLVKAQNWLNKVALPSVANAPLKELRTLLHAGRRSVPVCLCTGTLVISSFALALMVPAHHMLFSTGSRTRGVHSVLRSRQC